MKKLKQAGIVLGIIKAVISLIIITKSGKDKMEWPST